MQFNAKKKKKKKKKKKTDPDQTLCSVSSADIAQKVVKVKFGQIRLNYVFVGEQLYAKQIQYYALYLNISCLISSPVETICRKNQL